ITEAMASGLPVVAAKSGPTCEQIEDQRTGLLYDPDTPDDFTNVILQFKDETLRKRLSRTARESISELGWEAQSIQALDYYKEVVRLKEMALDPQPEQVKAGNK